jgi:hypothetical protein
MSNILFLGVMRSGARPGFGRAELHPYRNEVLSAASSVIFDRAKSNDPYATSNSVAVTPNSFAQQSPYLEEKT